MGLRKNNLATNLVLDQKLPVKVKCILMKTLYIRDI